MQTVKTLEKRHGKEREMRRIPVSLSNGKEIELLPGRQNVLVKKVIADFCSLYTPAGHVLYVSGTEMKWSYLDSDALTELGELRGSDTKIDISRVGENTPLNPLLIEGKEGSEGHGLHPCQSLLQGKYKNQDRRFSPALRGRKATCALSGRRLQLWR